MSRPAKHIPQKLTRRGPIRLGFVALIDAAPLVVAHEQGYFADEGLHVSLERQIGWANVRDKLAFGHLDASHALLGLPLASALRAQLHGEELISVMSLSSGGNAITLSRDLTAAGVNSTATLARYIADPHRDRQLVFAHVFPSSMHHYLLRDWLDSAGIHPDLDLRLCIVPPRQMPQHMESGHLDGLIVGEPWNTLAERLGCGRIVSHTTDILPAHPEKVLATTRRWTDSNQHLLVPLIRALLRACAYCGDDNHRSDLADILSRPNYLAIDPGAIDASLSLDRSFGLNPRFASAIRPADWIMRSFAPDHTFPSRTHMAWLLEQMIRLGHAPSDASPTDTANRCTDSRAYRLAAHALHIPCPPDEYPPMPLRGGRTFDVKLNLPAPLSA